MSLPVIRYYKGAELPDQAITWYDPAGDLYNFSTGWTFAVRVGVPGQAALATPSATGAATAPNLTITFDPDELATIAVGSYHLDIIPTFTGTSKNLHRTLLFQVLEGVAA